EGVLGPVRARRRAAARTHRAPIAAFQDRRAPRQGHRLRVLVDVADEVVDAEGALAFRERARRHALPEAIELTDDRLLLSAVRRRIEPAPRLVDEACVLVAIVA